MPEHFSPRSRMSEGWLRGEDYWGDPVTRNFLKIDLLLHPFVLSMTQPVPPESNNLGDQYIVAAGAGGVWTGHEKNIAMLTENGWIFFAPYPGIRIRLNNPKQWMFFDPDTNNWQREDIGDSTVPLEGTRYDVAVSVGYEAEPRETLLTFTPPQAMVLHAGATMSRARCTTPPAIDLVISLRRNNAEVGTLRFNATQMVGVFSVPLDVTITDIDIFSMVMPDATPVGFMNYNTTLRFILSPTETP